MPQVQFVDSTPNKPEPTGVQEFFSNLSKTYKDSKDKDTFGNLLKEYSQNTEAADSLPKLFADIEQSSMSPSNRLAATNKAHAIAKTISDRDKVLNERFKKTKEQVENEKEQQSYLGARDVLERQQELLDKGNLGPKMSLVGTPRKRGSTRDPEGIRDRAEYAQLGKSLISYATDIPIKNKAEFEALAEKLYDPYQTKEELEGIINAMRIIIDNGLKRTGYKQPESSTPKETPTQKLFQGKNTATLYNRSGKSTEVKANDSESMIKALLNGYASEGHVAMTSSSGEPLNVPESDVETVLEEGGDFINAK